MNCGVYKITDAETGRFYIGSSMDIRTRRTQHFSDLRHGRHRNAILQAIHDKGRSLEFSVYIVTRPEDRLMFEQRCIDLLKPALNLTQDTLAPMEGKTHSDAYKEVQRQRAFSEDSPLRSAAAVAARSGDNHYMRQPGYDPGKHPSKNPEIVAKRREKISGDNHYARRPGYVSKHKGRPKSGKILRGEKHPMFGKPNLNGAFANVIRYVPYWGA